MPHPFSRLSPFCFVALLSACAPVAEEEVIVTETISVEGELGGGGDAGEPGLADIELCDADAFRPLVGTSIAATALPEDPMLRAFGENDIITQDYRPQRTNILYDRGGTIIRVYCG